jgi:hypothetical protein
MMATQSIITSEYALSYGFYDFRTRSIESHLANRDRSYVYITKNHPEWMEDLASKNPKLLDRSLNVLALPGAHDAGMFEISNFKLLLKNEDLSNKLHSHLTDPLMCESMNFSDITDYLLEPIVINLACSKKMIFILCLIWESVISIFVRDIVMDLLRTFQSLRTKFSNNMRLFQAIFTTISCATY